MTPLERRRFELHAQTSGHQDRIRQARSNIETTFDRFNAPHLSVSGGKDSTVMHHLVTQQCGHTEVDVFHFDWGLRNVPGINAHVRDLVDEYGGTLIQRTSEGVTDEQAFARDEHNGMDGIMGWIATLNDERGWDADLLGIRADESPKRRDDYTGDPPTQQLGPLPAVAPIHGLTTADIWAYIVDHDLPYHDIYDDQGALYGGIDSRENRLVTIYDHEFASQGNESISQFLFPSETNELKDIEQRSGQVD